MASRSNKSGQSASKGGHNRAAQRKRQGLSQAEYARHRAARGLRGATQQMVAKARKRGWLVLHDDGSIDAAASDELWAQSSRAKADQPHSHSPERDKQGEPEDSPSYLVERARHERAKRELAEAELARVRAEQIDVRVVEAEWADLARRIRERLLGLPARLAPRLAALEADHEVREVLDAELRRTLIELDEEVRSEHAEGTDGEAGDEEEAA